MKKALITAISIVAILSGACSPSRLPFSCPVSEHMPITNFDFLPLWSRPGIAIYPDQSDSLMQGVASQVFVVAGQDFQYGGSKILALDTQSGNVLWQKNASLPSRTIATSNSQLYTGFYNKIEVLDPQTGNLVKEVEIPGVGSIHSIFPTEHHLYAFTTSGRHFTYNINDGTYSLSEPYLPYYPFLTESGIMYFSDLEAFKAKDIETQSILWENSISDNFTKQPLFADNTIILLTGMGSIYSLDKGTGKLLWKLDEHAISNAATNKSRLYFLTQDGYLKVLDINNGQEIAKLEFSPASFELNSPSSDNLIGAYDIWVDSQNDTVVLSFGDSCQIMGIKLGIE